jgi:hypothetical protein
MGRGCTNLLKDPGRALIEDFWILETKIQFNMHMHLKIKPAFTLKCAKKLKWFDEYQMIEV